VSPPPAPGSSDVDLQTQRIAEHIPIRDSTGITICY
jgi:hypothetical protein